MTLLLNSLRIFVLFIECINYGKLIRLLKIIRIFYDFGVYGTELCDQIYARILKQKKIILDNNVVKIAYTILK